MGFERCHPAVNLIFFSAVIAATLAFSHPVFTAIAFLCALCYALWRKGTKALYFALGLVPVILLFALYYSSYHHFGITELRRNFIGNRLTLESLAYGLSLGLRTGAVLLWMSCVYSVFSSDKVVYLFGKLHPGLSLFLAVLLRMVPRLKAEAKRIHTARRGIGKGIGQGNPLQRLLHCFQIFSMLISWLIEALGLMSDSMRARGSSLRGRTAFSLYRFDDRDRSYVLLLFACLVITLMALLLGQTELRYDPRLLWTAPTGLSYLFYTAFALLCLQPLLLELYTQFRFYRSRRGL